MCVFDLIRRFLSFSLLGFFIFSIICDGSMSKTFNVSNPMVQCSTICFVVGFLLLLSCQHKTYDNSILNEIFGILIHIGQETGCDSLLSWQCDNGECIGIAERW